MPKIPLYMNSDVFFMIKKQKHPLKQQIKKVTFLNSHLCDLKLLEVFVV